MKDLIEADDRGQVLDARVTSRSKWTVPLCRSGRDREEREGHVNVCCSELRSLRVSFFLICDACLPASGQAIRSHARRLYWPTLTLTFLFPSVSLRIFSSQERTLAHMKMIGASLERISLSSEHTSRAIFDVINTSDAFLHDVRKFSWLTQVLHWLSSVSFFLPII